MQEGIIRSYVEHQNNSDVVQANPIDDDVIDLFMVIYTGWLSRLGRVASGIVSIHG